ncbi:hypothetical protein C5167_027084 [Papaver somniferum]|uniref:E3 ubiquitin-protein ligase RGLG2-like n=1 Tax=Papaver somniferum TaxID=3469 RepID=UPI000E703760|nr:E3 ubiquitin-protein ligase RGLG2-like [Papaver somniferum]RZC89544.1 hypothetical protein C5167_027084 [Papaver somniferum]
MSISKHTSKSNNISTISDSDSLEKIKGALQQSELIVGFDFTQTNEQTGKISFGGNNLHQIRDGIQNPYEDVISVLGRGTKSPFDKDKPVFCFGFGDSKTRDVSVFSFNPGNKPCLGFDEALSRYRQIVPDLLLAEHKTFAPIINMAIEIVNKNHGKQHVLVIISNGPAYRCKYTDHGQLSSYEKNTVEAIKNARKYPLSIIFIGVGDMSGDMMRFFENNISRQDFEKIQIVNYNGIMSKDVPRSSKEMDFILTAMKKLPFPVKVIGGK